LDALPQAQEFRSHRDKGEDSRRLKEEDSKVENRITTNRLMDFHIYPAAFIHRIPVS
jgi:hypothetical protein